MNKLVAAALAVFAVSQSCSFAAGPSFVGVNYGPFHVGNQAPPNPIPDSQFQSDLTTISQKYIRTYEVGDKTRMDQLVPYIAKNLPGMKVYLGVWEAAENPQETIKQLNTAIKLANEHPSVVECIVVGNEANVSITKLIDDIKEVKEKAPNVKVTSCLTYGEVMTNGERLVRESGADFLMLNAYPFFAGIPIGDAIDNTIIYGYKAGQSKSLGKPVILGEVGWPSAGPEKGAAKPSVPNEETYIKGVVNASKDGRLGPIFLFEAFDELWKGDWNPNTWESSFGLWNKDGGEKFPIPPGH